MTDFNAKVEARKIEELCWTALHEGAGVKTAEMELIDELTTLQKNPAYFDEVKNQMNRDRIKPNGLPFAYFSYNKDGTLAELVIRKAMFQSRGHGYERIDFNSKVAMKTSFGPNTAWASEHAQLLNLSTCGSR